MKKFSKKFNKKAFRLTFLPVLLLCALMLGLTLKTGMLGGSSQDDSKDDGLENQLMTSGSWNLTSTPIFIDGDATGVDAHNWTWAVSQAWCSGDGNWGTPYLLENITIDGEGSGNCIEIRDSQDKYIRIKNCTTLHGNTGMKLLNVNNATLINNTCVNNTEYGITLDTCHNNSLIGNNGSYNRNPSGSASGIYLVNSDNNTLSLNFLEEIFSQNNDIRGIYLVSSNYNIIHKNYIYNITGYFPNGIYAKNSINLTITENVIQNYSGWTHNAIYLVNTNYSKIVNNNLTNVENAICLEDSYNDNVSLNKMIYCGINIEGDSSNNSIDSSNLVNGKPMRYYEKERLLTSANFSNSGQVILLDCNDSLISNVNISNTNRGLFTRSCINITISQCNFSFNLGSGAFLQGNNNTIKNSVISNNSNTGLGVFGDNISISLNTVDNNLGGMTIWVNHASVYDNNITNNGGNGIEFGGENNTLHDNNILNHNFGIKSNGLSHNNTIFLNNFSSNGEHVEDDGTNNRWDNGSIGNYYDDYGAEGGYDLDDDGIGDIPYNFTGTANAKDRYPIWDDGDDIDPKIQIITPTPNAVFNGTAPYFEIKVNETEVDSMWYTIDGGVINITFSQNETIDQGNWTAHAEGLLTLTFHVNDSGGNVNSSSVNIIKDSLAPNISIKSPTVNQLCGKNAPGFIVEINDTRLDDMWYVLPGGIIRPFTTNSTFNATEWKTLPNGTATIWFHANDTIGNLRSKSIIVRVDKYSPNITITTPSSNQQVSRTAPNFIIEVNGSDIHEMWYSLDSGLNNYTFTVNGSFNVVAWQARWDALANQSIMIITFYVNDSAGNINSTSVQVIVNKISTTPPATTTTTPSGGGELDIIGYGFLTGPMWIMTLGAVIGIILVITAEKRKDTPPSKKERDKIDEIVKNP